MAIHGGKRTGAGRRRNPAKDLAATGTSTADRILRELEHEKEILELYNGSTDARLKTHIIFRLREWAYGKPVQMQDNEHRFPRNPDGSAQTVRVIVEHIGRPADPAPAQTK